MSQVNPGESLGKKRDSEHAGIRIPILYIAAWNTAKINKPLKH